MQAFPFLAYIKGRLSPDAFTAPFDPLIQNLSNAEQPRTIIDKHIEIAREGALERCLGKELV